VPTMPLQDRVRLAVERAGLIPAGSRVLAAVSGGPDSVALLRLLLALADACGFTVAGVAHLNHRLRGAESDGDEAFCRALARAHGLAFSCGRRDVAALARATHASLETAARRARYAFLEQAAARLKAGVIATGHTRDDQAETFLLRLLRGAGASGLAGIPPKRGPIVRPLLDVRRAEILAYLARLRQPFRTDSSNQDRAIPRNWVRHELIPMLARHVKGDIVDVLAREAALLRDETELLDRLALDAGAIVERRGAGPTVALDAAALAGLPPALARRVVRRALGKTGSGRFHGFDHVEQVIDLARSATKGSRAADLPGVRVERNGAEVVLSERGPRAPRRREAFWYRLAVPGRIAVPECGCVIEARARRWSAAELPLAKAVSAGGRRAVVAAKAAAGGLAVRSRRPGDAFRPFGMRGRKKLQDVLTDRKVPRAERDRVPLVVDAADKILWVGGHILAEEARATARTRRVVVLSMRQSGRKGREA